MGCGLSNPPRTTSIELRKAMNEMGSTGEELFLVHRCTTGKARQCLSENLKTNREDTGLNNLFLPQINSDYLEVHLNSRAHRTGIACHVACELS